METGRTRTGESVGEKCPDRGGGVEEREESVDGGNRWWVDSSDDVVGPGEGESGMEMGDDVPSVLGMKRGARRGRFAGGSSTACSSLAL